MSNYHFIADIEYLLEKKYSDNYLNALKISDKILTLSQARSIITNDIENKFNDYIINK